MGTSTGSTAAPARVGDSYDTSRCFTAEDVSHFAGLTHDSNPMHIDPEFAAQGRFGACVVHGMLVGSLFGAIVGQRFPGAIYVSQTLEFRKPVFVGETVRATIQVQVSGEYANQVAHDEMNGNSMCEHAVVREIALQSMIEATAKARTQRADRHNTRASLQRMDYERDALVDIWFEPKEKEIKGWKGPAKVMSVMHENDTITVRWQGRTLDRKSSEVREHIPYFVYLTEFGCFGLAHGKYNAWLLIKEYIEHMRADSQPETYGMIQFGSTWM